MACSCKNGASAKQVTTVKQVVKRTAGSPVIGTKSPSATLIAKRIVHRRPI